jgi:DNA-directed RNA polymerase subunit beta'
MGVHGEGSIFSSVAEVISAYQQKEVDIHARIKVLGITNLKDSKLKDNEQKDLSKWKNYIKVKIRLYNSRKSDI